MSDGWKACSRRVDRVSCNQVLRRRVHTRTQYATYTGGGTSGQDGGACRVQSAQTYPSLDELTEEGVKMGADAATLPV